MFYKNILVIIEHDEQKKQLALERALSLARKLATAETPFKLTLFLSVYAFSHEMSQMASAGSRQSFHQAVLAKNKKFLDNIIQQKQADYPFIEFYSEVTWKHHDYAAIIEQVAIYKHDLVIKVAKPAEGLDALFFTPSDWHILRKCPCQILMVKDDNQDWQHNHHILTAVNVADTEDYHDILNHRLLITSQDLAKTLQTDLHLVSAYNATPVSMAIDLPEFSPTEFSNDIRKQYLVNMKSLRQQFAINDQHTHVEDGLPEQVIPKIANKIGAQIVVLGTIGRTGFSAAFLGNTAEHVIEKLNCDVLVVKPNREELETIQDDEM